MSTKNGFAIFADQYLRMGASRKAELYGFLAECDDEDIFTLYESTAFNVIGRGYLKKAVDELKGEGILTDEQASTVYYRYRNLHGEITAKQAYDYADERR